MSDLISASHSSLYNVHYQIIENAPQILWCGEAVLLPVELTNTGMVPWLTFGSHPVRLAYHWRTPQGHMVVQDGRRSLLPTSVPPDMRVIVELRAESPPEPGEYELVVDLVEEGIGWFSERGAEPLVIPVRYQPGTGSRACIINGNCVINDAVGNHVVAQLRALRNAGYHTLLLVEHLDERLPTDVRRSAVTLRLTDFQSPDDSVQHAVNHFFTSDVVIVNYSTYYELVQTIKMVRHSSVIFDYHGVTPPEHWDPHAPGYMDLVLGQQNMHLVQYADYAIAHSVFTRDELRQTKHISPKRVSVLPYAVVDHPIASQARDPELVERYRLAGQRVLLYVGRMARNKRIHDLVEALALVRQHHPHTVLLLVGENQFGPYRDYTTEVLARARELGCQEEVIFTGQVPDLEPYYQTCDLVVTASIHEGFCIPVVEAMAHGKPVVAAAATALPDTVGLAGLFFEPQNPSALADQILRLLGELPPLNEHLASSLVLQQRTGSHLAKSPSGGDTIVIVTPRYGLEILGGAERGIRGWAEQLTAQGHKVEVLTTCTVNMADWSNDYQPGTEFINGVMVRRFQADVVDVHAFHRVLAKANRDEYVSYADEQTFVQHNLQSSTLIQYLRTHAEEFRCAIFTPYLFGTTYWGVQAIRDKAIILPCLHNEPSARLTIFREMLEGAAGIFYNTEEEQEFAIRELGVVNPYTTVIGYGFPDSPLVGDRAMAQARYNLPEQFLLYSGRLESPKNVPLLLDYFVRYKNEYPGELTLVLAGTGDIPIPSRPDIIALGMIADPQLLADIYAAAIALCQPSLNESFSLVIMEAWLQGRPVLVHADCAVTRSHVEKSQGGYTFNSYAHFRAQLQRLIDDPLLATELGQSGRAYVLQNYTWKVITERIINGIDACVYNRSMYSRLVQYGIQRSLSFTYSRMQDMFLQVVNEVQNQTTLQSQIQQYRQLLHLTQIGNPTYKIRSQLPILGSLVAWGRWQLTSHLKEPYLDPLIQRQETFNREILNMVLVLLEQSLSEQRRLWREIEVLKERVSQQDK